MPSLINEHTQYVGSDGLPLVGGKLYVGTQNSDPRTTTIPIYSDRDLTNSLSNPQTLDANGRTTNKIWVGGKYSLQVDDSSGVQQYQALDVGEFEGTGIDKLFNVQGTNTITAEGSPTVGVLSDRQTYIFIAENTNTGPVTLQVDSNSAIDIKKYLTEDLNEGDIKADQVVSVVYNSTSNVFELVSLPNNLKRTFVTFKDFGAEGDGSTNDYTEIQAAIDYAEAQTEHIVIDLLGLTYICNSGLTVTASNITFINGSIDFSGSTDTKCITVQGTIGTALSLSANANISDETITLTDASSLSVDDFCVVDSGTVYWNTANTIPITQQFRIASIATNTLTLQDRLEYNFTTAGSADVRQLTFTENVNFENITLTGNRAVSQQGISFETCRNCYGKNIATHDMVDRGIGSREFSRDLDFDIINVFDSDASGTGYGVTFGGGVENSSARNVRCYNTRHPIAMGGESGLTRRCKGIDSYGFQCLAGFDMHPSADLCDYKRCHATLTNSGAASDDGMSIQGNRFNILECTVNGATRHGALFQILIDNLGGADSWGRANLSISDSAEHGLNISIKNGADLGAYSFDAVIQRPGEKGVNLELDGPSVDSMIFNCDAEATNASHEVFKTLITDTSSSRVHNLEISGKYVHSSTTPNAIEVNGDSNFNLRGPFVVNAYIQGGAHAVRTIDCNYALIDQVRYQGQGTAFTNLSGANNVTGSNVALP